MSKLLHAKGNLIDMALDKKFDIIVHGCNCHNVMGGGIAREIARRIPGAKEADQRTTAGDYTKLGNYTYFYGKDFWTINAYTQYNMSTSADVFEYVAFELVLQKISHNFNGNIGLPYIGMGLAVGDATRIMPIIEKFAHKYQGGTVTLVEFAP